MSSKSDEIRRTILAAKNFRKRAVSVPEWPGMESGLYVRSMSILDSIAWNKAVKPLADEDSVAPLYLAFTLCDEDGNKIFDPERDVEELGNMDADVISRLFSEALDQNQGGASPGEDGAEKP